MNRIYVNDCIVVSNYINYLYYSKAYINSPLDSLPFITSNFPPISCPINKRYIDIFNYNFELGIDKKIIYSFFDSLKIQSKNVIGIHLRSYYQKKFHHPEYLMIDLENRLMKIKYQLIDKFENDYIIFIATDVNNYIDKTIEIFGKNNVRFVEFISRIDNNNGSIPPDSIPNLKKDTGLKLGTDILNDCRILSLCDEIYLSNSNVTILVNLLNPNANIIQY